MVSAPGPRLTTDQQLVAVARAAARASTHLDLWGLSARAESRARLHEPLNEYWEAIRFTEHAHLVAFCVTIVSVFDKNAGSLRLPQICSELGEGVGEISEVAVIADKVKILRNWIFAHRDLNATWEQAYKAAGLTPDQMQQLVDVTLSVANTLLLSRGLNEVPRSTLPVEVYERMLLNCSRNGPSPDKPSRVRFL